MVIPDKMDKTLIVEHIARVPHPRFTKIVQRSKKYYVHDESGEAKIGDRVRIVETRPLSKLKRWTLAEIVSH
jgi:small subunit ribosomal protein S17